MSDTITQEMDQPLSETLVENSENTATQEPDYKTLYLRARADYDNAMRRMDKDRGEIGQFAQESVLKKVLPLFDTLLQNIPESEKESSLSQGAIVLQKSFLKFFDQWRVRPMESLNTQADESLHEVISQAPGEAGKIVAIAEPGYFIGEEKVLRHAKVVV
jgi:molecular chaperone GrpE